MLKFVYSHNLSYFIISHLISILFFTGIYYYLFFDMDKHYSLNKNTSKQEYLDNQFINSLYLSVNMETTTAFMDFNIKSPIGKLVTIIQLFLSLIISLGVISISFNNS